MRSLDWDPYCLFGDVPQGEEPVSVPFVKLELVNFPDDGLFLRICHFVLSVHLQVQVFQLGLDSVAVVSRPSPQTLLERLLPLEQDQRGRGKM